MKKMFLWSKSVVLIFVEKKRVFKAPIPIKRSKSDFVVSKWSLDNYLWLLLTAGFIFYSYTKVIIVLLLARIVKPNKFHHDDVEYSNGLCCVQCVCEIRKKKKKNKYSPSIGNCLSNFYVYMLNVVVSHWVK